MYTKPTELERTAHALASAAIKSGKLVRKPCIECGDPDTIAHHDDYNEPLRITWLCRKHHIAEHNLLIIMARRRMKAELAAARHATREIQPKLRLATGVNGFT